MKCFTMFALFCSLFASEAFAQPSNAPLANPLSLNSPLLVSANTNATDKLAFPAGTIIAVEQADGLYLTAVNGRAYGNGVSFTGERANNTLAAPTPLRKE